ncbi:MAG: MFS transporter [Salinibacterium sp.]|nr:MFS transporter [Salinibacterium sp.]
MNSRRAWVIYGVVVFAYIVAFLQRSSLGVAAVQATERFDVAATALSTLAVVQLLVYAALQIPTGVLLDRVGPKFLLAVGAALMMLGQTTLALSDTLGVAIVGRVLVGAGDAMTFISGIRLLASWFTGRRLTFVSQLFGSLGQFGQLLSTFPLAFVLHAVGWTPTYLSAAALSAIALVALIVIVTNGPSGQLEAREVLSWADSASHLRTALARPGTQLGFWSHFVTQSSLTTFALLWGFPFLSVALGYGPSAAAGLLTVTVASVLVTGPIIGILCARFPLRRSNVVIGIVIAMAVVWTALLSWPGQPPLWLVVLLLLVIAVGGPGSLIGFDFARSFNPMRAMGSASGIVNVGGFLASFIMMFLIGVVLDLIDRAHGGTGLPAELYSLASFRVAFLVQFGVVGIGMVFLIIARRTTRRRLHEEEGIDVGPLWVALVRRWRHRRG